VVAVNHGQEQDRLKEKPVKPSTRCAAEIVNGGDPGQIETTKYDEISGVFLIELAITGGKHHGHKLGIGQQASKGI